MEMVFCFMVRWPLVHSFPGLWLKMVFKMDNLRSHDFPIYHTAIILNPASIYAMLPVMSWASSLTKNRAYEPTP